MRFLQKIAGDVHIHLDRLSWDHDDRTHCGVVCANLEDRLGMNWDQLDQLIKIINKEHNQ